MSQITEQGLSPRTHALITSYGVGAPPRATEQPGLSEDMRTLIQQYVEALRPRAT